MVVAVGVRVDSLSHLVIPSHIGDNVNTNETDAYLMRKTSNSWQDLGKLGLAEYMALLKEVSYQEGVDEYRRQHSVASLMAAIYNTIPRKRGSKVFKASDFLQGDMPERNPRPEDSLEKLAEARGIQLPTKELKEKQ